MFSDWSMLIKMGVLQIMYTHTQRITKQMLPKLKKKKKKTSVVPGYWNIDDFLIHVSHSPPVLPEQFSVLHLALVPPGLGPYGRIPGGSPVAQMVKNLPAMQEMWVWSLGQEDPQRRKWLPTPVFLPGESHGHRSLAGYSPWGHKESNTTEWLTHTLVSSVGGAPVLRLHLWWTTFLSGTCFHSCGSWWVS